jgi:DnaK suppressor protein
VGKPTKKVAVPVAPPSSRKAGKSARLETKPAKAGKKGKESAPPQPVSPPIAVPTDGKPRKNVLGMTSRGLENFRDLLLAKRRELVGDVSSMETEALRTSGGTNLSNLPIHMADMGTDNYEQEFTLGLMEKDRNLLRDINQALAKIQDGTYGICEGTGKPISKARLEAQPWAKYSIEYARKRERHEVR